MRRLIAATLLLMAMATGAHAADATVRAFPAGPLNAFPLDSVRGVQSLMLHNVAVINTTGAPVTLATLEFELLRGGEPVERRVLGPADLARLSAGGASLQQAGMIEAVGFQFGDVLGKPAAKLSSTATLAPGEGLLVTAQVLSFSGQREAIRVTARAADGSIIATLSIPVIVAQPEARYRFPLKGSFYVQAGPSLNTHHRWAVPEEFALDIARIGTGGKTFRTDGRRLADYWVYGLPVLAAADGEVVSVVDRWGEDEGLIRKAGETQEAYYQRIVTAQNTRMAAEGAEVLAGNAVVVRHAWGEYSVYGHLKPGSVTVKVGQTVKAGDVLALVGSSGSSTEPHLHFHICDGPSALNCVGKPATFSNVENPMALLPGPIQSGDIVETK
jgi:multidrug efflux pump subunit AcrA (membrane-fusion protein)